MGITALPEQFSGLSASEVSLDGGFEPNRSQEIDSGQKAIWLKKIGFQLPWMNHPRSPGSYLRPPA